ncbi:MAG: tetratricopeptide repeat protein [Methylophilaceae bacterium]|nr:tetratricopeptide repeat protein [Methylophilaceae bacterium]
MADELTDVSQLVSQGQHAQALDKLNAYLATHPKDVAAQFLKGVILAEQNKVAEAIQIFSEITEKYPNLPEPYNNLAVLYAAQGQYEKARLSLERAIKTHPSYATAHENLGDVYAKMASDAYDKALQLDRSNMRAQTKLAMIKELFSNRGPGSTPPASTSIDAAKSSNVVKTAPVADTTKPAEDKSKSAPTPTAVKPAEVSAVNDQSTPMNTQQAVLNAVHAWAKAWSEKDVSAYLASYAEDFTPPNGETRSAWQAMRKERIRKPASIQVEVLDPKVNVEKDRAIVSFKQNYRAGNNSMRTFKTLHMRKIGERWLITREITGR